MKKISMFKPGVKSQHAMTLKNYDEDTDASKPDQFFGIRFKEACKDYFGVDYDPAFEPLNDQLDGYTNGPHRTVLAHADGCRLHTFAAARAVHHFLFNRTGRSFIFSPDAVTFLLVRALIQHLITRFPTLIDQLGFDAFSIWIKANPFRRLEWVHPDKLTDEFVLNATHHLTFVYVDKAQQCSNELLEALSASLWPHQASIIAGVPLSAQGAFKALWDDETFSRFKLTAHDMADYFMPGVQQLKLQVGEDSEHFRSMVLAEFPQA